MTYLASFGPDARAQEQPKDKESSEMSPSAVWKKEKDIIIYRDELFYSAFPSIVVRPSGEVLVAFRRAPERRAFGEKRSWHTDPNSYLVLVRSNDNAETWTKDPELMFAHPLGGSQDPCMNQLRDGSIVCSSYAWARLDDAAAAKVTGSLRHSNFVFLGGDLIRSEDGGHTWQGPIASSPVPGCVTKDVFGNPCPAYNRGAMCQTRDGRLLWAVVSQVRLDPRLAETHLRVSNDGGLTWDYSCPIARDDKASFNETTLYETPKGTLVAFMRTADFGDHTVIARSKDGGKSFEPWEDTGFQGHPHGVTRLPDNRVLLVYGYRHEPYGIRARILDPECTNAASAEEIVLRDDGGSSDLGYPWAALMKDGRALVAYYMNQDDGTRHIAGSILAPVR
jgi:hypothetical protein